jgi:anti-anti-sigma regulatory factor
MDREMTERHLTGRAVSRDDFTLTEHDVDDATRIVDVHGTIDAVRVASVLEAVACAQSEGLVLDLSQAAIARPDDLRALAGGLLRLRAGQPLVLVCDDPVVEDVLERLGVGDHIEVVASRAVARATLIVDRALDERPVARAAAPAPVSARRVRLDALDGVARVRVRDAQGALRHSGTAACWERRLQGALARLTLVVLDAGEEIAAYDAHAVHEVTAWMGDDGTLGATAVVA